MADHKTNAIQGVEHFLRTNRKEADARSYKEISLAEQIAIAEAEANAIPEPKPVVKERILFGNLDLEIAQANRKMIQEEAIRKGKKCK